MSRFEQIASAVGIIALLLAILTLLATIVMMACQIR